MNKRQIRSAVRNSINNVIYEGCTDVSIFERPFELNYLKRNSKEIEDDVTLKIENALLNGKGLATLKTNKLSYVLVPKKNFYDFRKCALIDIIDEIKYLSIVLLIARSIENNRVSKRVAFSYRLKKYESGRIFDKRYNYSLFKNEYKKLASTKKYNVMIECDIANFYDRLNLHRLNSTLLSIDAIDSKISNLIDDLLLFWANRDSYGLPVGSNASRILAEAFLIEIDNYLLSHGIKFCRFVDDYRFFAKNVYEANKILSIFVEILNKHGLSINTGKTNLKDIRDYKFNSSINKVSKDNNEISKIIRGYSGLVPSKFRKLSDKERRELKKEDEKEILDKLTNNSIIESKDIIKCLKIIVAKDKFNELKKFPNILKKYPQFVPYFSDIINKNKEFISNSIYTYILNEFAKWLKTPNTPEYILISIIRMYDASHEKEKIELFDFYKNLKRNSGIYLGRAILEQLGYNLTRGELLELKDYYLRADCWEKRQIVNMVLHGLSAQENRPFIKDLKINCNDIFILEMVKEYKRKTKNEKS